MSQFKGRLVNVGLAPQSNYTTPVTTPVYTVPWMDLSLKDTIETLQNESANGTIAHFNDSIVSGMVKAKSKRNCGTKVFIISFCGFSGRHQPKQRMVMALISTPLRWQIIISIWHKPW